MKHLLITLAITSASIFSNKSHAADGPTPPQALSSFRTAYGNVVNEKWSFVDNFYQASFLLNGRLALALYSADGTPIVLSKKVSTAELPAKLRMNLKRELNKSWVSDLFVVSSEKGDEYFVTVENADSKVVLRSYYGKKWKIYQTIAK